MWKKHYTTNGCMFVKPYKTKIAITYNGIGHNNFNNKESFDTEESYEVLMEYFIHENEPDKSKERSNFLQSIK